MDEIERQTLLGLVGRGKRAPEPTAEGRAEWERLYAEAGSAAALGRLLNKPSRTVNYHLHRHGIVLATGFRSPKTVVHRGAGHANWKGGTYSHSNGYTYEYAPEHPAANSAKGYVLQHRLVMERHLGRYLTNQEIIHHRNEVKDDNRLENLELTTRGSHMSHHKDGAPRDLRGHFS